MLSFELSFPGEKTERLRQVYYAKLDCQLDVPADSLTLTLPFASRYRDAVYAAAWEGETLRFYGPVDEVVTVRQSGKLTMRLYARSLAAFLLDNEAEPLTYENPSNRMMAQRHLLPFGITDYDNERHPLYDSLQINKGMSHWQALERFCRKRYGAAPRIEGRRAYLKGFSREGEVLFGENGVRCLSLHEYLRPCRLISELRVRINAVKGYSSVLRNPDPRCEERSRVRYLNAISDNRDLDTARRMMEKGDREAYMLKLKCVGMRADLLGMAAVVEDGGVGRIDGLRVTGVRCVMNKSGELTTVSLRKERF